MNFAEKPYELNFKVLFIRRLTAVNKPMECIIVSRTSPRCRPLLHSSTAAGCQFTLGLKIPT